MLKRSFLIMSVFLIIASHLPVGASMDINAEVIVPIGKYTNSSINLSPNPVTFVNAAECSSTLELASSQRVSGAIKMILTSGPLDVPSLSVPSLGKYLKIEASESITDNLNYVIIKFYYTEEEVIASGLEEGSLGFYWWDQSSSSWEKLTSSMEWVNGAGVDTLGNYVWANVTHFSDYSVGGLRISPSIEITRNMPISVRTNQKFVVNLKLNNLADFEFSNISIREKIPTGYDLIKNKDNNKDRDNNKDIDNNKDRDNNKDIDNNKDKDNKHDLNYEITPIPYEIKNENGATIIYWKINKLASHKNISLVYSLSAPNRAGEFIFRADIFGFDAFKNKYTAFNIAEQEVIKPPLWRRFLDFAKNLHFI